MRNLICALAVMVLHGAGPAIHGHPYTSSQAQASASEPAIGFTSDAGTTFNLIKASSVADFEMVLGRLKEALQKSADPQRKQQAASWKVYKSTDPSPDGNVLYLFMFDNVVKGVDYDPIKILSEAFSEQVVKDLYAKLVNAYVSLNKASFAKLMDMSTAATYVQPQPERPAIADQGPPPQTAYQGTLTQVQQNAARSAKTYLEVSGFSRRGLIAQLSSDHGEKFSVADATVAVDSLNVDWNAQAVRSALAYLKISGFSCQGLIEQLSSDHGDKYTVEQATYGARRARAC